MMGLYEKNLVAFKRDPGRENMNIKVKFYKKTLGLPRSGQIVPSRAARTIFPYNLPRRVSLCKYVLFFKKIVIQKNQKCFSNNGFMKTEIREIIS